MIFYYYYYPIPILFAHVAGIFIVGAKRTAFGTFGGKLKDHTATDLAAAATVAALKSAGIAPEHVDTAICGNVSSVCRHVHFTYLLVRGNSVKIQISFTQKRFISKNFLPQEIHVFLDVW